MVSPIRILHVVVNMNRGGAETLIMNLYRSVDRTQIQFDFLTCKPGVFDEEIRALGGNIHRIPYISDVGHFKYTKELNAFFHDHKEYQIVHSHMDKMSGLVLRAAHKAGIPVRIAHSHNTQSEGNLVTRLYKSLSGELLKKHASHKFACSKAASSWLFGSDLDVTILKNGIDTKNFYPDPQFKQAIRKQFNIKKNSIVIGHIGRFCKQKNHEFLIDVFYALQLKFTDSYLYLIGDGPLKEDILARIRKYKLQDKVILLGVRNDVNKIIHLFDVMIFPSLHEGLPVTIVEAQSSGIPCVLSNSITKEVDLGVSLIEFHSIKNKPDVWVEAVMKSLTKKVNDPLCYIVEKGYDVQVTATRLEEFYGNEYAYARKVKDNSIQFHTG